MNTKLAYAFSIGVAAFAGGVATTTSCGNGGGMTDASADDGGSCNCPAAEAPLAGRIRRQYKSVPIPALGIIDFVPCDPGGDSTDPTKGILLGGGCNIDNDASGMYLVRARAGTEEIGVGNPEVHEYQCEVRNPDGIVGSNLEITAICLYPTVE